MCEDCVKAVGWPPGSRVRSHRCSMTPLRVRIANIVLIGLVGACGHPVGNEPVLRTRDPDAAPASTALALVGVRVVPMTSNVVLGDQTVVVRDGVIAAIGPSATTPVPAGATVVTGSGRYVMPALIDMHVHLA